MAEIFTTAGLDYLLDVFPKAATPPANLYLGFFTSQTAVTVPAATATGGATPSGWTEAIGTGYLRVAIPSASWGAAQSAIGGRKAVATQVTFATVGSGGWGTLNGYFLATASASGGGDVILMFANFDDESPIVSVAGDVIKMTPSLQCNS